MAPSATLLLLVFFFFIVPSVAKLDGTEQLGLDLAKLLQENGTFYIMSSLLTASGVAKELQIDEAGPGITLLAPPDSSFADTAVESFPVLPAFKKSIVLKFHVLPSYYTHGMLSVMVNPAEPTLATADMGAGRFLLKIYQTNGSAAIDTGLVKAYVTRTIYDKKPVAVHEVSKVLLPNEYF